MRMEARARQSPRRLGGFICWRRRLLHLAAMVTWLGSSLPLALSAATFSGTVKDPQGKAVIGAAVRLKDQAGTLLKESRSGDRGGFEMQIPNGRDCVLTADHAGFSTVSRSVSVEQNQVLAVSLQFTEFAGQTQQIEVSAKVLEPTVDLRNAEVFNRTLFTRDDQIFQQLNSGINAGQHEGGGKSLEIRRFGFNLDHGGTNGGLKVMVDDVQQNQGTQGHGQGYLGSLKALSPELIKDVKIINGPFSAEFGDFSGLGVVQIEQRESLSEELTLRLQAGNLDTGRGFFAYSPNVDRVDSYLAYEGSYTDGPFINPGRYRRDNVNANYTKTLDSSQKLGFRFLFGRNNFYSSGQIPLDLVAQGFLDRFGYLDPSNGGRVKLGTVSTNYTKTLGDGDVLRVDGFVGRSLFDLFSNFTFFLHNRDTGDGFQQHDSRLQEGANSQYIHTHKVGSISGVLIVGGNYHDSQINVGLYPLESRVPLGVATRANARVTNGAAYIQENLSFFSNRLIVGAGLRLDEFRWNLKDRIVPVHGGTEAAGHWQPKVNLAFTPSSSVPLTLYANYGRGINSVDARAVVQRPANVRLATTDFYQFGASSHLGRMGFSSDLFLIDHSNEQVYIPDDGSFEFKGPSRAYGFETKASFSLTHHLSLNAGLTKIANAFYRGGEQRVYVDSAPHFVSNAALTLAAWRGWSGSFRMRAINHYRLDGQNSSIVASGLTVFDTGIAKQIHHGIELNLSLDNLLNRDYYETQNYLESRVTPIAPVVARIHGTPGYRLTVVAGITFRLHAK